MDFNYDNLDYSQPIRPFRWSESFLPATVVKLLHNNPDVQAAYKAGLEAARGSGSKPLTCRRCRETPMLNGIVTIRDGHLDHTSPLCESCIAELGDNADPPDGHAA